MSEVVQRVSATAGGVKEDFARASPPLLSRQRRIALGVLSRPVDVDPGLCRLAPDLHRRIEPGGVLQGARFDEREVGHGLDVGHDRRTTFPAEPPHYRQSAFADIIEGLERPACDPEAVLWHGNDHRERRAALLLAMRTVADRRQQRLGVAGVPDAAAQTTTINLAHGMVAPLALDQPSRAPRRQIPMA